MEGIAVGIVLSVLWVTLGFAVLRLFNKAQGLHEQGGWGLFIVLVWPLFLVIDMFCGGD